MKRLRKHVGTLYTGFIIGIFIFFGGMVLMMNKHMEPAPVYWVGVGLLSVGVIVGVLSFIIMIHVEEDERVEKAAEQKRNERVEKWEKGEP